MSRSLSIMEYSFHAELQHMTTHKIEHHVFYNKITIIIIIIIDGALC